MNLKHLLFKCLCRVFYISILLAAGCALKNTAAIKPDNLTEKDAVQQKEQQSGLFITGIIFEKADSTARIVIQAEGGSVAYTAFRLSDSSSLVIDIPDADVDKVKAPLSVKNEFVNTISAVQEQAGASKIGRIMVGLKDGIDHKIDLLERKLVVSLFRTGEGTKEKVEKEGSVSASVKTAQKITAIEIVKNERDVTEIKISADGELWDFDAFGLDEPPRLVIDIFGAGLGITDKEINVGGEYVKRIRLGGHKDKVRLVFESVSKNLNPYSVNVSGKAMFVSYTLKNNEKKEGTGEGNKVTSIAFKPSSEGAGSKLIITTIKTADYKVLESMDNKSVVIDLKGTAMSQEFKKVVDLSLLHVPVASVTAYELNNLKVARVMVKLKEQISYNVVQDGNNIYVNFSDISFSDIKEKISSDAKKTAVSSGSADKTLAPVKQKEGSKKISKLDEAKVVVSHDLKEEKKEAVEQLMEKKAEKIAEPKPETQVLPDNAKNEQSQYTGKKISLDFQDVDIGNVIRLIAEVSHLNIIASDEVTGKITLRLKDVPWDQAFDIILKSKGLGKIQEGNVIRIAPLSRIKEQEKLEDLISERIVLNYANAKDMEDKVRGVLSTREGASVTSDERTNTIIITDMPAKVKSAVELVRGLDTQTPQVIIEARIVEASSSFTRDLGIQWGLDVSNTGGDQRYAVGGATSTTGLAALGGTTAQSSQTAGGIATSSGVRNFAVNLPVASPLGAIGFTFGKLTGDTWTLDLKLTAAETAGLSKIISRPKIATIDNKEATISQGKKIPYQTTSSSGTETKFIDATLKLKVTSHIIPDGTILMKVDVTKNSKGEDTSAGPVILEKAASTEILLKDMETAVIGGIVETQESDSTSGMPWLKDVPGIGWLFKSKSKSDSQTELLIFITPTIQKGKL